MNAKMKFFPRFGASFGFYFASNECEFLLVIQNKEKIMEKAE